MTDTEIFFAEQDARMNLPYETEDEYISRLTLQRTK